MKNSKFMSILVTQSDRMKISSNKNAVVFIIILISSIHITDADRNKTHKYRERCKEFHWRSGNMGITACKSATLITTLHDLSQAF